MQCVRGRNKGKHKIQNLVSKIIFWEVWADLVNLLIGYYRRTLVSTLFLQMFSSPHLNFIRSNENRRRVENKSFRFTVSWEKEKALADFFLQKKKFLTLDSFVPIYLLLVTNKWGCNEFEALFCFVLLNPLVENMELLHSCSVFLSRLFATTNF